ncbi:MAG: 50S ribosomal protein L21 [Armatimonadota bacterium]|nr:50S ribosomal protein L21 [Armatimonadota bacterium]
MVAVIRVSGKQYRVQDGAQLLVDRLPVEEGATVEGVEVLMVGDGDNLQVGTPTVAGAKVTATALRHTKGKKIRVFKYKPKKNYRRRIGARAHLTLLRIDSITA